MRLLAARCSFHRVYHPHVSTPKKRSKRAAGRTAPERADYGKPIDGFFAKQPPHLRVILEALRELVEKNAPDAVASLKWGMPFYSIGGRMMCALAGFKSHVNLILAASPSELDDPEGLLEGAGRGSRHLKLRALDELPKKSVRSWVRTAARIARARALGRRNEK